MRLNFSWMVIAIIAITGIISCKDDKNNVAVKEYKSPCGCVLSDEDMIKLCPVDAIGDSIAICKIGTNNVIGSGRPPMKWQEYIESEYFGGEGKLTDCKTGKPLLTDVHDRVLSYKNKKLLVDSRERFDIYVPEKKEWIDLDLQVWRNIVYAVNGEIKITPDSLVFKPAFQDAKAFEVVAKEYEAEEKKTDHYLISRTVNHLFMCAANGDKLSEERLLNVPVTFAEYYNTHEDSKKIIEQRIALYKAYQTHLNNVGKRTYYDLTIFPYFKELKKKADK